MAEVFNNEMSLGNLDGEMLKDPSKISYSSALGIIRHAQSTIKALEKYCKGKIPDSKKQGKEIRRKERLKSMFEVYLQSLKLTPEFPVGNKQAYVSSESQIKSLITHQYYLLSDLENKSSNLVNKAFSFSPAVYQNPMIFKILALFAPESKQFLPQSTNYTICSVYFHDEALALKTKTALAKEVEYKLAEFRSKSLINGLINKRKKIDFLYTEVQQKLIKEVNKIYKKRKMLDIQDNKLEENKISEEELPDKVEEKNEFLEGDRIFCVDFEKAEIDTGKTFRRMQMTYDLDETIEVHWTAHSSNVNMMRLGFFSNRS